MSITQINQGVLNFSFLSLFNLKVGSTCPNHSQATPVRVKVLILRRPKQLALQKELGTWKTKGWLIWFGIEFLIFKIKNNSGNQHDTLTHWSVFQDVLSFLDFQPFMSTTSCDWSSTLQGVEKNTGFVEDGRVASLVMSSMNAEKHGKPWSPMPK